MASRSRVVIPVLIGLNAAVFLLWVFGAADERLGDFLRENFLVSRAHLADGRFWTLLTAGFSHAELWHLVLNMMVLHSFGTVLGEISWLFQTVRQPLPFVLMSTRTTPGSVVAPPEG